MERCQHTCAESEQHSGMNTQSIDDDALLRNFALLLAREGVAARLRPDVSVAEISALIEDLRPRLTLSSPPSDGAAAANTNGHSSPDSGASAGSPTDMMHCDAAAPSTSSTSSYKLQLSHDCQSSACGGDGCTLCAYNPIKPCAGRELAPRCLVDAPLRAPCGASVSARVVCAATGAPAPASSLASLALEVVLLDGERYATLCPGATSAAAASASSLNSNLLAECAVSAEPGTAPLMRGDASCTAPGAAPDRLLLTLARGGAASLSALACAVSSEALLSGRAPSYRLLVRAVPAPGGMMTKPSPAALVLAASIAPAVSPPFVVVTRRMKSALKPDVPCTADDVTRLRNVGKATAAKLRDLAGAAARESSSGGAASALALLPLPPALAATGGCVEKVGQFCELAVALAGDAAARQTVQALLKLSSAAWDDTVAHAAAAVPPDARRRAYYAADRRAWLLFSATRGAIEEEGGPVAVALGERGESELGVAALRQADAALAAALPALRARALRDWGAPGHPGWRVYWRDSGEAFVAAAAPPPAAAAPPPPMWPPAAAQAAAAHAAAQATAQVVTNAPSAFKHAGSDGGFGSDGDNASDGGGASPLELLQQRRSLLMSALGEVDTQLAARSISCVPSALQHQQSQQRQLTPSASMRSSSSFNASAAHAAVTAADEAAALFGGHDGPEGLRWQSAPLPVLSHAQIAAAASGELPPWAAATAAAAASADLTPQGSDDDALAAFAAGGAPRWPAPSSLPRARSAVSVRPGVKRCLSDIVPPGGVAAGSAFAASIASAPLPLLGAQQQFDQHHAAMMSGGWQAPAQQQQLTPQQHEAARLAAQAELQQQQQAARRNGPLQFFGWKRRQQDGGGVAPSPSLSSPPPAAVSTPGLSSASGNHGGCALVAPAPLGKAGVPPTVFEVEEDSLACIDGSDLFHGWAEGESDELLMAMATAGAGLLDDE